VTFWEETSRTVRTQNLTAMRISGVSAKVVRYGSVRSARSAAVCIPHDQLRGLAGNRRGIADSDFWGRDLTDGADSKFDSNADLRGIGKGCQIRVREVSAVRGCVFRMTSCAGLREMGAGWRIVIFWEETSRTARTQNLTAMRICGVAAKAVRYESVRSARSVAVCIPHDQLRGFTRKHVG
jgi:hypothetical protein